VGWSPAGGWRLEARRLRLRGRHPIGLHNEVLTAWLMTPVLFGAFVVAFGPGVLVLLVVQAVWGFTLLETVNYVEHYGLLRQRNESGRYEKVTPRHSWNSDALMTNIFLLHLQRHSDHHANPVRRYQVLRSFEESPQLPAGYATLIVLCLIPPLWCRVMDPRVITHYDGDVFSANIHPPARNRYLARYGLPEAEFPTGLNRRGLPGNRTDPPFATALRRLDFRKVRLLTIECAAAGLSRERGNRVAQKVLTTLQDDIDGSKASETIVFAIDGVAYQIDLNVKHATKLRKTFAPFISAGRRVGGRSTRRATGPAAAAAPAPARRRGRPAQVETPVDPAAVRAWASANRIKVSPRGRIPSSVIEQFRAAGH
jgi:hypothetical protein